MTITPWKRRTARRIERHVGNMLITIFESCNEEEYHVAFSYLDAYLPWPRAFGSEKEARDWVDNAIGAKEDHVPVS
jgi:hypothetical protein